MSSLSATGSPPCALAQKASARFAIEGTVSVITTASHGRFDDRATKPIRA